MTTETSTIPAYLVEKQLKRLQSSPLFSHSRRYPIFLDYVVRQTLDGHGDDLKERTVGVEAFGRPAGYDLNADPIVRVTAGEVRKRLAQYYYEPDHKDELRIELRPGSYVPEFRMAQHPESLTLSVQVNSVVEPALLPAVPAVIPTPVHLEPFPPLPSPPANRWKSIAIVLAVLLVLAGLAAVRSLHRASALDAFWQPVIEANGPVFISVGSVVAMVNGGAVAPPPSTVSGHPLASDPIALSDAQALSNIQQVLSVRSKESTLQSSTGTSFADLQKGPFVLLSGFNNQWTMRITDPLRFHLVRNGTDEYAIQDRSESRQWRIDTAAPFVKMSKDYGLLARFHDPTTDQLVIVAAGIGENGTIAASHVLSDDKYLSELRRARTFPRPDQNFEAVVESEIIDGKPGPPRIVATYIW